MIAARLRLRGQPFAVSKNERRHCVKVCGQFLAYFQSRVERCQHRLPLLPPVSVASTAAHRSARRSRSHEFYQRVHVGRSIIRFLEAIADVDSPGMPFDRPLE
jgi:hypothetical protein